MVYEIREFIGQWNPQTQEIEITSRGPVLYPANIRYSVNKCALLGDAPLFVSYYGDGNIVWSQTLQDAVFTSSNGIKYVGEAVSELGHVATPGEAKITMNPIVGEAIEESSTIRQSCADGSIINRGYHWRYQTSAHYDNWRGYRDVFVTGLIEFNPGGTPAVYNYAFARDVGLIAFWYGLLDANGNVSQRYEFFSPPEKS